MKFKKWKQEVKSIKFDIPDVYDKIKPYAYQKKHEPLTIQLLKRPRFSFAPIFVILFLIVFTIFSVGNNSQDRYLSGNHYLSYFTDPTQINDYLRSNKENENLYLKDYRDNSVLSFKVEEKANQIFDVSDYLPKRINEYLEEAITIKAEDNLIYTISPKALNIIDTSGEKMEIVFTKRLSINPQREGEKIQAELHLLKDYLIIIYTDKNYQNNITNVLAYDKTFSEVYNYQVYGNYLDSKLIDNKLYLFNQVPLSSYLNSDEQIPLPKIIDNFIPKNIDASNIGYILGFGGEAYTIISCLDLNDEITSDDIILLSYNDWKQIHLTKDSLYLINSHQNTDDNLEYGIYTSLIRYDIKDRINYSSSVKFKGATLNNSAFDEYNGYIRVGVTAVNYNVNKNLLQTKIEPESLSNKILIMKEVGNRDFKRMNLISVYDISSNEHLEEVRFIDTDAYVLTQTNKIYQINLNNPSNPKLNNIIDASDAQLFYYPLSDNLAFTIKVNKLRNGYIVTPYSISDAIMEPWKQSHEIKYNDYSYFPVIDAINNSDAIFASKIQNNYYFGFGINNLNQNMGDYLLFEINPLTKTFQKIPFQFSNFYPTRMIATKSGIYALSSDTLYLYNNHFEEIEKLEFPY